MTKEEEEASKGGRPERAGCVTVAARMKLCLFFFAPSLTNSSWLVWELAFDSALIANNCGFFEIIELKPLLKNILRLNNAIVRCCGNTCQDSDSHPGSPTPLHPDHPFFCAPKCCFATFFTGPCAPLCVGTTGVNFAPHTRFCPCHTVLFPPAKKK